MGKVSGEDVKVQNLSFENRKALARPPRFEPEGVYTNPVHKKVP